MTTNKVHFCTLLFLYLNFLFFQSGQVNAIECHNCISHKDDLDSCQSTTLRDLRTELRTVEGPQFQISDNPDACVKIRLQAVLDNTEIVIRTQVKLNDATQRAIFKRGQGQFDENCEERFINSFMNHKEVEVNILACACTSDHCNHQSSIKPQFTIISLLFIIPAILLS